MTTILIFLICPFVTNLHLMYERTYILNIFFFATNDFILLNFICKLLEFCTQIKLGLRELYLVVWQFPLSVRSKKIIFSGILHTVTKYYYLLLV